jgi:hypothetical protein
VYHHTIQREKETNLESPADRVGRHHHPFSRLEIDRLLMIATTKLYYPLKSGKWEHRPWSREANSQVATVMKKDFFFFFVTFIQQQQKSGTQN